MFICFPLARYAATFQRSALGWEDSPIDRQCEHITFEGITIGISATDSHMKSSSSKNSWFYLLKNGARFSLDIPLLGFHKSFLHLSFEAFNFWTISVTQTPNTMMGSLFWSFWRGQLKWYIKMMIIWFQKYGSDRAHLATNQRLACRTVQRAPSPWGRLEVHTAIMVQGADPQGMRKSFNIRWRDIYMFQNVFTFTYDLCLYLQCVVTDQVSRSTECEFSWFIFMNLMVAHCFNSAQKMMFHGLTHLDFTVQPKVAT